MSDVCLNCLYVEAMLQHWALLCLLKKALESSASCLGCWLLAEMNSRWWSELFLRLLGRSHLLNNLLVLRVWRLHLSQEARLLEPGAGSLPRNCPVPWSRARSTKEEVAAVEPCVLHSPGMDGREMDFYEDYESPFDFNTGVNKNYLYLSPSGNTSPPGSPTLQKFGNS